MGGINAKEHIGLPRPVPQRAGQYVTDSMCLQNEEKCSTPYKSVESCEKAPWQAFPSEQQKKRSTTSIKLLRHPENKHITIFVNQHSELLHY